MNALVVREGTTEAKTVQDERETIEIKGKRITEAGLGSFFGFVDGQYQYLCPEHGWEPIPTVYEINENLGHPESPVDYYLVLPVRSNDGDLRPRLDDFPLDKVANINKEEINTGLVAIFQYIPATNEFNQYRPVGGWSPVESLNAWAERKGYITSTKEDVAPDTSEIEDEDAVFDQAEQEDAELVKNAAQVDAATNEGMGSAFGC